MGKLEFRKGKLMFQVTQCVCGRSFGPGTANCLEGRSCRVPGVTALDPRWGSSHTGQGRLQQPGLACSLEAWTVLSPSPTGNCAPQVSQARARPLCQVQPGSPGSQHARMQVPRGDSPGGRKLGPGLGKPPLHLLTSRDSHMIPGAQGRKKMWAPCSRTSKNFKMG